MEIKVMTNDRRQMTEDRKTNFTPPYTDIHCFKVVRSDASFHMSYILCPMSQPQAEGFKL